MGKNEGRVEGGDRQQTTRIEPLSRAVSASTIVRTHSCDKLSVHAEQERTGQFCSIVCLDWTDKLLKKTTRNIKQRTTKESVQAQTRRPRQASDSKGDAALLTTQLSGGGPTVTKGHHTSNHSPVDANLPPLAGIPPPLRAGAHCTVRHLHGVTPLRRYVRRNKGVLTTAHENMTA